MEGCSRTVNVVCIHQSSYPMLSHKRSGINPSEFLSAQLATHPKSTKFLKSRTLGHNGWGERNRLNIVVQRCGAPPEGEHHSAIQIYWIPKIKNPWSRWLRREEHIKYSSLNIVVQRCSAPLRHRRCLCETRRPRSVACALAPAAASATWPASREDCFHAYWVMDRISGGVSGLHRDWTGAKTAGRLIKRAYYGEPGFNPAKNM